MLEVRPGGPWEEKRSARSSRPRQGASRNIPRSAGEAFRLKEKGPAQRTEPEIPPRGASRGPGPRPSSSAHRARGSERGPLVSWGEFGTGPRENSSGVEGGPQED